MRKICALTANRADFSRLESILDAIKKRSDLKLQLVVMGSHLLPEKGRTIDEIIKKGFKPDFQIDMEVPGGTPLTMTKSVGLAIMKLTDIFGKLQPDVVIVPVDRFESLAMGVTAALMNIHVAHIQGGEVTGTIDESIRHALTKLSHLHFVATAGSRERVIKMGEPADTVFNVGCPATDLLLRAPEYDRATTLKKINDLLPPERRLDANKPFIFVIQHPVTTEFSSAREQMAETFKAIANFDEQSIVLWPNIDAGGEAITALIKEFCRRLKSTHVLAHIPTELFANVLRHTACQVGNSSSGIRESCYFGTPVVNIGSRQASRERGSNVINVGNDSSDIEAAIRKQMNHDKYPIEKIYGDGTAGEQIAAILGTIALPPIQKKITY